jgi:hypothetical protein
VATFLWIGWQTSVEYARATAATNALSNNADIAKVQQ